LKAKFAKAGVLVTLVFDDGFERDELMKVDLQSGIFTHGKETVIFTPDPVFVDEPPKITDLSGTTVKGRKSVDVPIDQKKIIDEAILNRSFTDTGKAHYTCLISKGIAVTPTLLKLIKDVNSRADESKIYLGNLVEPQILKSYFKGTFSAATLQNMEFAAERRGFLRRPMQDFFDKNKISIVFVLLIVIVGYMILSGKVDLSRIFGGFLPGGGA